MREGAAWRSGCDEVSAMLVGDGEALG